MKKISKIHNKIVSRKGILTQSNLQIIDETPQVDEHERKELIDDIIQLNDIVSYYEDQYDGFINKNRYDKYRKFIIKIFIGIYIIN